MIIRKIETVNASSDIVIYSSGKNDVKKQYIVTDKKMKEEKLAEGELNCIRKIWFFIIIRK